MGDMTIRFFRVRDLICRGEKRMDITLFVNQFFMQK